MGKLYLYYQFNRTVTLCNIKQSGFNVFKKSYTKYSFLTKYRFHSCLTIIWSFFLYIWQVFVEIQEITVSNYVVWFSVWWALQLYICICNKWRRPISFQNYKNHIRKVCVLQIRTHLPTLSNSFCLFDGSIFSCSISVPNSICR